MIGEVNVYGIPPPGWYCSHGHNHDGPRAAHRIVDTKLRHISREDYTDYKPGFGLCKEQHEAINKWIDEHDKAKHISPGLW